MNVESVDSADYTLRLKRRKGEFTGIQVENSQNRTEKPGNWLLSRSTAAIKMPTDNAAARRRLIFPSAQPTDRSKIRGIDAASGQQETP
jgi:hypothetical protein